jgi:hypothetical protein
MAFGLQKEPLPKLKASGVEEAILDGTENGRTHGSV